MAKDKATLLGAATLIIAILGAVIVFGQDKNQIKTNTETLRVITQDTLPSVIKDLSKHETKIAVLETKVDNIVQNTQDIKKMLEEMKREQRRKP